ncbi:23S rRNA (pseudouridine(1915)-N(3))-methyltransferase RlmH [Campylobacter mucosalis]|uniref:Ribosomal RNA large subunit methyltransferase H n=1 Tax=Campylobacter mucosalis CCUG 21559 TaxID=1032067 RepID=A0A6G5QF14_9BACT|nr:23S rRNA (pseudouridine(1915)-N(3))-methyltransferase RlmH [Campylobacter mucosalis]KEA46016.1 50S rRNA methyltransferase [Campylobacter mucosalis]QCD44241.1 SPOUT methyltransferase [Campylobacter mucosalis CCUG 21559]QKF63563.1 SPOUT methyltransferase [Campylobacter mucosalis]
MDINVFSIQKSSADSFENEIKSYIKMSSKFASLNDTIIFNDKIAKAQNLSRNDALNAYDDVYIPKMNSGYNVILDENGKSLDSKEFAKIFSKNSRINFFIGGAYGISQNLKQKADMLVSLSAMTMAHKIAKLVLFEQIFRGLCINAGHPYHK